MFIVIADLLCNLRGHAINRRRVWSDGFDYRATCGRCFRDLIRHSEGWRKFDLERDNIVPHNHRLRHAR